MTRNNSPRNLAAIIYILSAGAIACFFFASMLTRTFERTPSYRTALLFVWFMSAPLVLAGTYARMVLDPIMDKRRTLLTLAVNISGIAMSVFYLTLLRTPGVRLPEFSLIATLILGVGVPIAFLIVSREILRNGKFRYIFGTIAAAGVWPFMTLLALSSGIQTWDYPETAAILYAGFCCTVLFAFAAGATFYKPRAGYISGLAAGCIALSFLTYSELRLRSFELQNSWLAFNLSDRDNFGSVLVSKLKILSVGLAVIAIVVSALRLIPRGWRLRRIPLSNRKWPAFAISLGVIVTWFCYAVMPYRIPVAVDGFGGIRFRALHIEKEGFQLHETYVAVGREGRFSIVRNDRRLFQYQFQLSSEGGVLPPNIEQWVSALNLSPQLTQDSAWPGPLRKWHAEGWYVLAAGTRGIATFTSELGTVPPKELTELFHEIESVKVTAGDTWKLRDVCLGFCYDPPAGLGFIYENSRCFTDATGTQCK